MGSAIHIFGLSSWVLLMAPCAQAQNIVGVDVFLHFAAPLDGTLEKTAVSILHDVNEQAALHIAEDRQQAKFTATVEHDLLLLTEMMQAAGVPLVGFTAMWSGTPTFLSRATTPNGPILLSASAGPTSEQIALVKETWIAAFPEVYERLCKGPVSAPMIE